MFGVLLLMMFSVTVVILSVENENYQRSPASR